MLTNNVTSLSRVVCALDKYTDYEFQVLAFSSKGDGPKSSVVVERTKEDGKLILVKHSTCTIMLGKKLNMHFSGQSTIPTISITTDICTVVVVISTFIYSHIYGVYEGSFNHRE